MVGFPRADVHAAVDLPGIGIHGFERKGGRQPHRDGGLPDPGWSYDREQRRRASPRPTQLRLISRSDRRLTIGRP
jgi:hypothetical protein